MNIDTRQLIALLGSETAAQRFVQLFLDGLPEQLRLLRSSLDQGDNETAANTAHGLKSQCRYLGLEAAAEILQHIENEPDAVDMPAKMAQVEQLLRNL